MPIYDTEYDILQGDVQLQQPLLPLPLHHHHTPGMGRRFIDISDYLKRFLSSLLLRFSFFFLCPLLISASVSLSIFFSQVLASVFFRLVSLHPAAGPGLFFWVASLGGLHVGHLKKDTQPRGYESGTLGFSSCLFFFFFLFDHVVWNGCFLLIEHGMPLMMIGRSYVSCSPAQTGIECQQDTLGRQRQKSEAHLRCRSNQPSLCPTRNGVRRQDEASTVRRRYTTPPVAGSGCWDKSSSACGTRSLVPMDARRSSVLVSSSSLPPDIAVRSDCRLISYTSGLRLGRSAPLGSESDAGHRSLLLLKQ